jgi:hypothetical protein
MRPYVINCEDGKRATDDADRNAVNDLDDNVSHTHALSREVGQAMAGRIAQHPVKSRVRQAAEGAVIRDEESAATQAHGCPFLINRGARHGLFNAPEADAVKKREVILCIFAGWGDARSIRCPPDPTEWLTRRQYPLKRPAMNGKCPGSTPNFTLCARQCFQWIRSLSAGVRRFEFQGCP